MIVAADVAGAGEFLDQGRFAVVVPGIGVDLVSHRLDLLLVGHARRFDVVAENVFALRRDQDRRHAQLGCDTDQIATAARQPGEIALLAQQDTGQIEAPDQVSYAIFLFVDLRLDKHGTPPGASLNVCLGLVGIELAMGFRQSNLSLVVICCPHNYHISLKKLYQHAILCFTD